MSFESLLRQDILSKEHLQKPRVLTIEHVSRQVYQSLVDEAKRFPPRTQSPEPAKNIIEVMDLARQAIEDYEKRTHITGENKIHFRYENVDENADLPAITVELTQRDPGMFAQGRPNESSTRQLRPLLRQEVEDPDNPGYKRAVFGQWYDNTLTFTAWARTNKRANELALWLENVFEEYTWFFVHQGVNRFLYQGRRDEKVREVSNQKVYGRPINYFVRTEKLRTVSQKELEQVCLRLGVATKG